MDLTKFIQTKINKALKIKPSNITCECACKTFLKGNAMIEPVYAYRKTNPIKAPNMPNDKGYIQSFFGNIDHKIKNAEHYSALIN
jgi:hypothetical protein